MSELLTNARLVDPQEGTVTEGALLVGEGRIAAVLHDPAEIRAAAKTAARQVDCDGKVLAPGIVDLGVKICEPGERHKESFRSAGRAAAAGGVTTMITRPDTDPAIDSPEQLEFIARRAAQAAWACAAMT